MKKEVEITGCRRIERGRERGRGGGGLRRAALLSFKWVKDNGIQTGVEPEIQVFAICATANGLQMSNKLELEVDFCLWNKAGRDQYMHVRWCYLIYANRSELMPEFCVPSHI